jgi:hypothetical protein
MIVQYIGIAFVGIIFICVVSTIITCIFSKGNTPYTNKQNKKLLDNMKKLKK